MKFITFLFWAIIIYYSLKFILRLIAPFLFQKAMKHAQQTFEKKAQEFQQNQYRNYQQSSSEFSSNTQEQSPKGKYPKAKKQVGEYVDFEEIKD